jgi:hypothetical protein
MQGVRGRRLLAGAAAALAVIGVAVLPATPAAAATSGNIEYKYTINLTNVKTGKCIQPRSTAQGAGIVEEACDSSNGLQQWDVYWDQGYIDTEVDSYDEFINVADGMCLADPGGDRTKGRQLVQWPCEAQDAQRYEVTEITEGYSESVNYYSYSIASFASRLNMAVSAGNPADGTNIIQWSPNAGDEQSWLLFDE